MVVARGVEEVLLAPVTVAQQGVPLGRSPSERDRQRVALGVAAAHGLAPVGAGVVLVHGLLSSRPAVVAGVPARAGPGVPSATSASSSTHQGHLPICASAHSRVGRKIHTSSCYRYSLYDSVSAPAYVY